jgi:hypothetical protein
MSMAKRCDNGDGGLRLSYYAAETLNQFVSITCRILINERVPNIKYFPVSLNRDAIESDFASLFAWALTGSVVRT